MSAQLPIRPLRKYLLQIRKENNWNNTDLARYFNTPLKNIKRWIGDDEDPSRFVNIDAIDRAFTHIREPWMLEELWPLPEEVETEAKETL